MKTHYSQCVFRTALFGASIATLLTCGVASALQQLPFNQSAVKQSTDQALLGPNPANPYFHVRFALPIPPENDKLRGGSSVGIDAAVADHHNSPAFEIMPNGDALMISYSGPSGREGGPETLMAQTRLRYGAEEFDMPEHVSVGGKSLIELLKADGQRVTGAPPLLWREGSTVWMFMGGHHFQGMPQPPDDSRPGGFRVFKSMDNGATWEIVALEPTFSALSADSQPITNAFRAPNGDMFVACDGKDGAGTSMLWRSSNNGLSWTDQGGRTSGRHSTIVPLNDSGRLLSLGGKDTQMSGYMPQNISTNWGVTWGGQTKSPFPWLGANQRPSMIRLASGNLVMVGDSRFIHNPDTTPSGWTHGDAPYVALSTDNGSSWTIKALPVALRHDWALHKTIGYSTVRQAPNGVIHILAVNCHPSLHYELNEAWITTPSAGDIAPETTGGTVQSYSETHPGGAPKATWSARRTTGGRYLLDGVETHFYPDGKKQREVTWVSGRRTGPETLWGLDGTRIWSWNHDLANNVSTWTHWWSNGQKRLESQWNTNPVARDLPARNFRGLVAHGTSRHWNPSGQQTGQFAFLDGNRIFPLGNHSERFATDPGGRGWTGSNNTTNGNSFGWSSTTSSANDSNRTYMTDKGEIGGVFARSSTYRWFADTNIGTKNRTQTLRMSGIFNLANVNFDGAFRIGYFTTSGPANNFIGLEIREPAGTILNPLLYGSGTRFRAYLTVNGPGGTSSSLPLELDGGQGKAFDLIWRGNSDGSGTLSGSVQSIPLPAITVGAGTSNFNAFGLLNGGMSSNSATEVTGSCWFDNLVYDKGTVTTHTLTYDANGATSGSEPSSQTKPSGVNIPVSANSGNLAKAGFKFAGWKSTAGTNYAPGALYTVNENTTLSAQWTAATTFNINYDPNGATGGAAPATQIKTQNEALTLSANSGNLTRTGHVFAGWNTARDGSGTDYSPGQTYAADAPLQLFAKWAAIPTKTLRIMPMGDSITAGIDAFPSGYRLPLYNLLQAGGYSFDFVGNKSRLNDQTPDKNHWSVGGMQLSTTPGTVEGRSYVSIQGQNRGGIFGEMSDAISTSYFSTDSSSTRNIILLHIGINDVLHQVVDSLYGSFNTDTGNNGFGEGQEQVAEGLIARMQALLKSINNHATTRNLRIEVILGTLCPLTKEWYERDPTENDPVSDVLLEEVEQYNRIITSLIPTLSFSNISVKVVDQNSVTVGKLYDGLHPNGDGLDAMAQVWYAALGAPSTSTVTFDAGDGSDPSPASKTVTVGAAYGALPTTTLANQTFAGWWTGPGGTGTEVTAATNVANESNHTLYAKWTGASTTTYTVTYNANQATSGTAPANQIKTEDVQLTLATNSGNLARTGFTFAGWNTAADGTGTDYAAGGSYTGNEDLNLYAKWTELPPLGPQATETFDSSASAAANGWSGSGNTTSGNSYGWSSTGLGSGGSAGGTFARNIGFSHYADTTIVALNRTNTMRLAGSFSLSNQDFDGHIYLGYFTPGEGVTNFLGIQINEPSGSAGNPFRGMARVAGAGGADSSFISLPQNTTLAFDLLWAGSPNGSGTLSGTLAGQSVNISVAAGSGSFTAFGLLTGGMGTTVSNQNTAGCYFDNLTYNKNGSSTAITSYTVSYDANQATSGTAPADQTKTEDLPLTLATNSGNLARTGFAFAGWNTAADGTGTDYAAGGSYTVNDDLALFAKWTAVASYSVTYNANQATSGTAPASQAKTQDVPLTLATNSGNLARTGFTFAGWNTAADGTGSDYAAGATYSGNEDLTLYARWTDSSAWNWITTGTTTQNWSTTSNWSPATVPSQAGAVVNFTANLTAGQAVSLASARTIGTLNLGLPGNANRYNFSNTANGLTFRANSGDTLGTATININNNSDVNDGHQVQGTVNLQVANLIINNNSVDGRVNFQRTFNDGDGDATRSPNVTLNAVAGSNVLQFQIQASDTTSRNQWGKLAVNQNATFRNSNPNAVSGIVSDQALGRSLTSVLADAITLNGGTLQGGSSSLTYNISANRGITLGALGGTLQRSWTVDSVITGAGGLTLSPNGSTLPTTLNAVNTYTGDTIVNGTLAVTSGNAIPDSGKLVINTGGRINPSGTTETVATLFFGTEQQAAGTWGASGSGASNINDTYFTGTGVVSVTSGPNAVIFTVSYDANQATSGTAPAGQTKTHDLSLTLAINSGNLARTGYTFAGWNTAADGTGTDYAEGASYTDNANLSLFARWTANTYTVSYDANQATSGTAPAGQTKTHDLSLPLATNSGNLARTGYTFAGWNTAADGTGTDYAEGASYSDNANLSLFARWTANTYTVSYDANGATGGTAPANQTKTHDVALTLATNSGGLAKVGFTFAGWNTAADGSGTNYAEGESYTAEEDAILYARWAASYTITYDGNGNTSGTAPDPQVATQDVPITLAANTGGLAKTGFFFAGWNTAADGTGTQYAAGATYSGNEDLTLYARWTDSIIWIQTDAGTQQWDTTGNWLGGINTSAAGDIINFTADLATTPGPTVGMGATRTLRTLNLGLAGNPFRYNFSNNTLALKANADNTLGTATINVNNDVEDVDGHSLQGQVNMQVENVVLNLNSAGARLNFWRHFSDHDGDSARRPTMTLNAVQGAGVHQFAAQAGSTSRNTWGKLVVNEHATFRNSNPNQTDNVVDDLVMGATLASPVADAITLNGGILQGGSSSLTYNISANRGITLGTLGGTLQRSWTVDSVITGAGGLTLSPDGSTLPTTLNAVNTYTGDTIVNGTLAVTSGNAIPDSGKLVINTGGRINPSGTTETVATLFFGTEQQAAGTWGATGSGATNIDDTHFTGTGVVSVTSGSGSSIDSTPFEQWAGDPGMEFDGDAGGDGIRNGMAFLLGATGPQESARHLLPVPARTTEGLTLSFKMLDAESRGSAGMSVEYSSDLVSWTTVSVPDTSGTSPSGVAFEISGSGMHNVKVTIPSIHAAGGKLYARLKAIEK